MSLLIREMAPEDARAFLEVHHAAVRHTAAKDYPLNVVESWAPLPITEEAVLRVRANPDNEFRLVAELDSKVVGIGVLVSDKSELRACYVAPDHTRRGIGSVLVCEIERVAQNGGLSSLQLVSSITAEPFYAVLGYDVVERGEHILSSGVPMRCVKMCKSFPPPQP
jgi:putative acetyltransferase